MTLTPSAMDATADAVAALLGPTWQTVANPDGPGTALFINGDTPAAQVGLRLIFSGRTLALWISAETVSYNRAHNAWARGVKTWNTGLHLTRPGADDPAQRIADTIREHLLPAAIRRPRYVGDRPWDHLCVFAPEVGTPGPAPAKKPRARRSRKKTATTS
ncbi:hypothetical protein ACIQXD_29445 [Streptomyces uncialis]|uniref:hypothetical protein n=1 Tax=Streptomyces uncialis TaxID=1048205 RepID=UPI00380AD4E2